MRERGSAPRLITAASNEISESSRSHVRIDAECRPLNRTPLNEPAKLAVACSPGRKPGDRRQRTIRARFSGRQILSPAKAGLIIKGSPTQGSAPFGSLHPGLHSAAGSAGSLSVQTHELGTQNNFVFEKMRIIQLLNINAVGSKRQTRLNVFGRKVREI